MNTLIHQLLSHPHLDHDILKKLKRSYAKEHHLSDVPSHIQLLAVYREMVSSGEVSPSRQLESLLKKRAIRSASGIVPVQVLTKPYWCPGKCIFCPNDFTMPKSYINTEPGAMRALLNNFDPRKQVHNRLLSLTLTGHATDKIEMIVLGGTRDVYPQEYKEEFVKGLYDACNSFEDFFASLEIDRDNTKSSQYTTQEFPYEYPSTIQQSIAINENASHRIIGLTVETRPEYVNDENCRFWRELGVTRIEMGIQSMFDHVLTANKRGHSVEQSRQAVHKLRQYGFKMSVHIMPGLYGSSVAEDIETFRLIYSDPWIRPDEIKFYPTSVIPNTELYDLYLAGEYKPLQTDIIQQIIRTTFREIIPPYTRIKRLIRDIPSTEIVAGSSVTNLAQMTHDAIARELIDDAAGRRELYQRLYPGLIHYDDIADSVQLAVTDHHTYVPRGWRPDDESVRNFVSLDTRSREIRHVSDIKKHLKTTNTDTTLETAVIVRAYRSSVGREYFIAIEDTLGYLYGFTRLLLPDASHTVQRAGLGPDTAMIRELHVYGQLQQIGKSGDDVQHTGIGKTLLSTAEQLAQTAGYHYLSIISGVGVRAYYHKRGYNLQGTYMVKTLAKG